MKKRDLIVLLCGAALFVVLLSGCTGIGHGDSDGDDIKKVSATELANAVRGKYSDSETVVYADERLEIERDESLLVEYSFDPVAAGMDSYPQIAALYLDQALTQEVPATYEWADEAKTSYRISPWSSPLNPISQTGLDESTPGYDGDALFLFDRGKGNDWGNHETLYLAQWVDYQTGKALDKPIVSVVTVRGELDTPEVCLTVTDDGVAEFSWEPVNGATSYLVLEIPLYGSDSTGHATVVGQTDDTTWADEVKEDAISGSTWLANNRFANYLISEDDWLSESMVEAYAGEYNPADGAVRDGGMISCYTVVAINDSGTSMFGEMISGDEVAKQLPHALAYNMEKQSENGFSAYVNGIGMMPAYRWIVLCDGSLSPRLVNYDTGNVKAGTSTVYSYEKEDMSDMKVETVSTLQIPYTVEGTPFYGTLTVQNYDADNYRSQLDAIAARQESLRSQSGSIERDVNARLGKGGDTTQPAKPVDGSGQVTATDDAITANSALSEYLAINMIGNVETIDLSAFPESKDPKYLADAWSEAVYQNPLILGVSSASILGDGKALSVEYEEDTSTRIKQQKELRAVAEQITDEIIADGMSDLEKEYAINQYLCDNGEYDNGALKNAEANNFQQVDAEYYDSFTAYGILVNHVGVCASYAAAFKLLADEAGLESVVVTGYLEGSVPHAWNRVNLGNGWDTIDVTNNDMELLPNALLNLPDGALSNVLVEDTGYAIDDTLGRYASSDTDSEYYRINGKYYPRDEIAAQLAQQLKSNSTVILRTNYALTDAQFYDIGGQVVKLTGNPNLGGFYWLGVIVITNEHA